MQVTTEGVISFRDPISDYNSRPFPLSSSEILIAPFWDISSIQFFGQVLFRLSSNQTLLNEVGSTIHDDDFTPKKLLIATWNGIPFEFRANTHRVCNS